MSHLMIQNLTDLEFIINYEIVLLGKNSSVQEEIYHNMWAINFDSTIIKTVTIKDLDSFLLKLLRKRSEQISQKYPRQKATFYLWYDCQSAQICFNLLSGKNRTLPFGCTLKIKQKPNQIFKNFLKDLQSDVPPLSYENFKFITPEDPEWNKDDDEEIEWILDVYVATLP